jgi:hypothetical protein
VSNQENILLKKNSLCQTNATTKNGCTANLGIVLKAVAEK